MQLSWLRNDIDTEAKSMAALRDRHELYSTVSLCIRYAGRGAVGSLLRVPYTAAAGLISSDIGADYATVTDNSGLLGGLSPEDFALFEHTHPYALREGENISCQFSNGITADLLSPADHYHREYRRRGDTHTTAEALGGLSLSEYSLASHTHDEYVPRSEYFTAAASYTIGGLSASQLAPAEHIHGEYIPIDEPVAEAENFLNSHGLVISVTSLAEAGHNHDDNFYTKRQASQIFISDGVLGNTDRLSIDTLNATLSGYITGYGRGSADYAMLLFPYNTEGLSPSAYVSADLATVEVSQKNVSLQFFDLWLMPGCYVTLSIGAGSEVVGVLPSVTLKSAFGEMAGKSTYVTVYYKGSEVYVRAVEYEDVFTSMKVRLAVLVKED